jgi:hypothetical protein
MIHPQGAQQQWFQVSEHTGGRGEGGFWWWVWEKGGFDAHVHLRCNTTYLPLSCRIYLGQVLLHHKASLS